MCIRDSQEVVGLTLMMNSRFLLAPLVLAFLFAGTRSTYAQTEKESGVKEAMRQKVGHSQQVPEYELFLNEFRRNAQELMKAGQQKNLDAASLAYVQMTLSCVSCHQFIRQSSGTGSSLDFRPKLYVGNK